MIGYQLYSSRNWPLAETLPMLRGLGYETVEGFEGLYPTLDDAKRLKDALDAAGLRMPTGHLSVGMVEDEPKLAPDIARTLGFEAAFAPFVGGAERPADAGGWRAFGRRVAEAGKVMEDAGLAYGWHNHDFELRTLPDGSVPLDWIAEAGVALELDVAWVVRGGADPLAVIDRHGDLIRAVHVKDVAPDGEKADEDGWADPGTGTLDWTRIAAALAPVRPAHWIAEHDNPSDHGRFARAAMEMAKAIEGPAA